MAWTAPTTRATSDLITASIWNTDLVDNLDYLNARPSDSYNVNQGSDYTTTSTSFVDVDATNLALSITTNGGDVLIGFTGAAKHSTLAGAIYLDVYESVGAARLGGDDGLFLFSEPVANYAVNISFSIIATGLAAGSHTFKLQWKTISGTMTLWAGAGTSSFDLHPQFWVKEV